mmetsp:Transcript_2410/g.4141  ORF Transcript_2410/g.4141 Transcript_2410/m.4141 type:complete len:318 (-) Transcript_2410:435-1388(-)
MGLLQEMRRDESAHPGADDRGAGAIRLPHLSVNQDVVQLRCQPTQQGPSLGRQNVRLQGPPRHNRETGLVQLAPIVLLRPVVAPWDIHGTECHPQPEWRVVAEDHIRQGQRFARHLVRLLEEFHLFEMICTIHGQNLRELVEAEVVGSRGHRLRRAPPHLLCGGHGVQPRDAPRSEAPAEEGELRAGAASYAKDRIVGVQGRLAAHELRQVFAGVVVGRGTFPVAQIHPCLDTSTCSVTSQEALQRGDQPGAKAVIMETTEEPQHRPRRRQNRQQRPQRGRARAQAPVDEAQREEGTRNDIHGDGNLTIGGWPMSWS